MARLTGVLGGAVSLALLVVAFGGVPGVEPNVVQAWWLVAAALGAAIMGATAPTAWRAAGVLAGMLFLGAAAQLALTQPLWYQFVWIRPTSAFQGVLWLAVFAQALVAAGALLMGRARWALGPVPRAFGLGRLAAFAALLTAVAAGAMRHIGDHNYGDLGKQLVVAAAFLAVNFATVLAFALRLPAEGLAALREGTARLITLPGADGVARPLDRAVPLAAAGFLFLAATLLGQFAFEHTPRLADEVSYLFQARYLAQGLIYAPAPPDAAVAALSHDFVVAESGRWYSIFPPGWPAMLALGVRLGAPWLVNPLLGAISILAAHAVASRLMGRSVAHVAVLLMAASPWLIAMSASMMAHTATLALALGGIYLLLKAREGASAWALIAGALMGLLFLTRPIEGLIAGVAVGLWLLPQLRTRRGWRVAIGYGVGCVVLGGLIFPYNAALVGDPLTPPIEAYFNALWHPGANRMGFGPDIGPPNQWGGVDLYPGHSPLEAAISAQYAAYMLNLDLFGWGVGSLALVIAMALWGRWRKLELAMAGVVVATAGAFALYWFNDSFYIGPRYWFLMFMPLIVLSAGGLTAVGARLTAGWSATAAARLTAGVLLLCCFGSLAFTTWRGATRYFEFRGFTADYRRIAAANDLGGALVFVHTAAQPDYSSAFGLNDPMLPREKPIFVRDLGPEKNREVATAFPGRRILYVEGRTAGKAARIVPGPFATN